MKVLISLDELSVRLWSYLLSLLCRATGKSNFFFARICSAIGMGALGMLYVLLAVYDFQYTVVFGFVDCIVAFAFFDILRTTWRVARELEKGVENGDIHFDVLEKDIKMILLHRVAGTIICILALLAGDLFFSGLLVPAVASLYFLTDFRPRGKSPVRKLAEALMQKLKSVQPPSPVPAPSPA